MKPQTFVIGVKNRNNPGSLKSPALVEVVVNGAYQAVSAGDEVILELDGYNSSTILNQAEVAAYVNQMNPRWCRDFGKQLVLVGRTYMWQ